MPPSEKRGRGASARRSRSRFSARPQHNVVTADNDHLAPAMSDIVPDEFRGTDRYLDVIQWNIEWFGARKSVKKDEQRLGLVLDIFDALNGDLFILQEVAGPSRDGRYPGALDIVAEELSTRGSGDYVVFYTQAGGEQRVAMMWDRAWVRAKNDVSDLFPRGTHKSSSGKDAFAQRTPLYGFFTGKVPVNPDNAAAGTDKFEFQVLGVHLKAMAEGHEQRLASAKILANWLTEEAPLIDADAMIIGDWNAPPDDKCWAPFHKLEKGAKPKVSFSDINDPSDFSYLWLRNRTDKFVSRIDLTAMSLASTEKVVGRAAEVVHWKPIQEVLAEAANLTDKAVVQVMKEIKETISDHLPTVSRFYFAEDSQPGE